MRWRSPIGLFSAIPRISFDPAADSASILSLSLSLCLSWLSDSEVTNSDRRSEAVSGVSLMKRVSGREAVNQAALARPAVCGATKSVAREAKTRRSNFDCPEHRELLSRSRGTLGTLRLRSIYFIMLARHDRTSRKFSNNYRYSAFGNLNCTHTINNCSITSLPLPSSLLFSALRDAKNERTRARVGLLFFTSGEREREREREIERPAGSLNPPAQPNLPAITSRARYPPENRPTARQPASVRCIREDVHADFPKLNWTRAKLRARGMSSARNGAACRAATAAAVAAAGRLNPDRRA